MKRIGIVKDDLFLKHTNGPQHPECPERLESINTMLDSSGLISKLEVLDPVDATEEQIQQKALASEKVIAAMAGAEPRKIIVIKSRLVNIIV